MKKSEIKLFCLCILTILMGITTTSAKDYGNLGYDEAPDVISEVEHSSYIDLEAYSNLGTAIVAAPLIGGNCYELKRVWVWSGWRPKRVWKWVKITCPQAARGRGPGTTIPPH